ncbi:MAG: apolipoprotein N-acyltransferase [Weeksellaceae bacterium]|nr:apolipoprotein N-acyltransferase [Weeksellaceae bacterium]
MWKTFLLASFTGFLLSMSWSSQGFPGFLFIAFIPLLLIEWQISESPFKRKKTIIFFSSWLAFAIWNAITYFWLSKARPAVDPTAMEVQQAWFAYLAPVILNSLFMATVFMIFNFFRTKHGSFYGYLALICFWMSFENMHLNWELSWPWLNLGNGFAHYPSWVQFYESTGTFGGTLWVLLTNITLFVGLKRLLQREARKKYLRFFASGIALILIPLVFSIIRYSTYEEKGDAVEVMVLQPRLDPYREKYQKHESQIAQELVQLARENVNENTQIIVGPETAIPGRGQSDIKHLPNNPLFGEVKQLLEERSNLVFITGAELVNITQATQSPSPASIQIERDMWYNAYNSVVKMESASNDFDVYHKSKLVVGVELFPYTSLFKPILGTAMLDFGGSVHSLSTQEERSVFSNSFNSAKVAPVICYESIFGAFTASFVRNGANVILVPTNDSWWGNTDGHLQFLDYARLRAIETRRDVARAANSGVSAFINQRGDITSALPYDTRGTLQKPMLLNEELTFYARNGDWLARLALFLAGILVAYHFSGLVLKLMSKYSKR